MDTTTHAPAAPGHRALRRGRHTETQRAYLVTITTCGRTCFFDDFDAACATARLMRDRTLWRASRPLCWVLMPDHLHALLELGEGDALDGLMARIKSATSRHVNGVLHRKGSVWARAYHDRALRRDDDARAVARCIVANPLRAGLVERIGDYPFWDAEWLSRGDASPV